MTPHEVISLKIAELDAALKAAHPSMPSLLQIIHRDLNADPEVTTLLTSAQCAIICAGLSKQTQTQITTSKLTGGKGKTLKNVSIDDI